MLSRPLDDMSDFYSRRPVATWRIVFYGILAAAGVAFEIVPGISSTIAGPCYAGIPVTHRGLSAALLILSGHDLFAAAETLRGASNASTHVSGPGTS